MRFDGRLKSWDDDRGFGFIEPRLGGDDLFVHVKAFRKRRGRPVVGQPLSFEVEIGPKGRKQAKAVEPIIAEIPARRRARSSASLNGLALAAIGSFVALYLVVASIWRLPWWVAGLYLAMSIVCAVAYVVDKSAAEHGRRRVREQTLIALGLLGGWPGAVVAQQLMRHKTVKASFQAAFRFSVIANVVAFLAFGCWWAPLHR